MRVMRKSMVILIACLLLLAFVTSMTSSAARVITFWLMPNAPSDAHTAWLDAKVAEFKKETGITVNYEVIGWGDAWNRLATAVTSGEGADVIQVGTTWNPQFAAMGGLARINIAEFGGEAAFIPANYKSTTYKNICYGIPWFAETRCLFYNKDHFAQVGVKPPETYDELVTVSRAIVKARGNGTAIAIAGNQAWDLLHNWAIVLWAYGGDLLSSDLKTATFAGPEGVQAMTWYVDLIRNGFASKACAEYNQPDADAAFINGNVSMCFMGPWNITNIMTDNPRLNYGVVEPPAGPKGRAAFSGGSNLAILANSRNQADAKTWVKFLIRKNTLLSYTKDLTRFLPSTIDAFADPFFDQGVYRTFRSAMKYSTAYPQLGVWGSIENAIVGQFKEILTDYVKGTLAVNDIPRYLNVARDRVNAALKTER